MPNTLWSIHFGAFATLGLCAGADPIFGSVWPPPEFQALGQLPAIRVGVIASAILLASSSLLAIVARTVCHSKPESRSVTQLLAITTCIAMWCGFISYSDSITWQGKRIRFALRVRQLEALAAPLQASWPESDGEIANLGPFMAYPFGDPRTLVLLQSPQVARTSVYISAIERGSNGSLRMQTTGTDGGDWVEWHQPDNLPESFIDGLGDAHSLETFGAIGNGWYLVRYQDPVTRG